MYVNKPSINNQHTLNLQLEALPNKFHDIPEHKNEPSKARLSHDQKAIKESKCLNAVQIYDYLISGEGGIDPDKDIDEDDLFDCQRVMSSTLEDAYDLSSTFRRLFNYAYDNGLNDVRERWLLGAGEEFGATVTKEQISDAGGRKVICMNVDEPKDKYACISGEYQFDIERSIIHEVVHALTLFVDKEDDHPRGPVVEYTNIILKEMGNKSPARTSYQLPDV
ncbi:MAG: PipA/GogA/GtgA family type III secretion system effector [Shewanella sp.]